MNPEEPKGVVDMLIYWVVGIIIIGVVGALVSAFTGGISPVHP